MGARTYELTQETEGSRMANGSRSCNNDVGTVVCCTLFTIVGVSLTIVTVFAILHGVPNSSKSIR